MNQFKTVFVTGGAGFIGSNFLSLVVPRFPSTQFVNLDMLTYASNLMSLKDIQDAPNYFFEQVDIRNPEQVDSVFQKYSPDCVVHFAAESHVDRSIHSPRNFIETNITGTFNLLEAFKQFRSNSPQGLFHHVSTDEVYGSLGDTGKFTETHPYDPRSPYSASKAASDHLVKAYFSTYGLPVKVTNCSNNYGPRQFPEKLIPLMILNALDGKELPVYGSGRNVRDWLYVTDHCEAILAVIEKGKPGETYNIGGNCEKSNLDVVEAICAILAEKTGKTTEEFTSRIRFVTDRPGHDWRYAMDTTRITTELGWTPKESFESGLKKTVEWYLENTEWVQSIQSKEYLNWIQKNYTKR